MLESVFKKVAGLTPFLKNICQRLLLHCTRTTHRYLSVLFYIQQVLPHHDCYYSEAVIRRCSIKRMLLEFSQNSLGNTCDTVYVGLRAASLLKKRHQRKCFSVSFEKFLRTSFATEHL